METLACLQQSEAEGPNSDDAPLVPDSEERETMDDAHGDTLLGLTRNRFLGALSINAAAFILPALYTTLSKLWVANIDSTMVVTTDVFTYMTTMAEVINEGLPRAAWSTIGDSSSRTLSQRLSLAHTLILSQAILGLGLSLALLLAADAVSASFVPAAVRARSLAYVRISSFSALSSAIETAAAASTRALDQPDVPLFFNCVKFATNIALDMLLISTFRVATWEPTVNMQAGIQLACNLTAAVAGLAYFMAKHSFPSNRSTSAMASVAPCLDAFRAMLRPGLFTFLESAIRNSLYLWLVRTIISMGSVYATAWGVFNTIRWGLVMVPVHALEATTLTFVGHEWGRWRQQVGVHPRASLASLHRIVRPAILSTVLALGFEIPICILISVTGARPFARWLSGSDRVAAVTERMWRTLDWCYIMYAVSTQLAAVLLATRPKWFLLQSLASNLIYVLPWAIVCQVVHLNERNAWTYHALVFGGSLVFSFVCVPVVLALWALVLKSGRARLGPVK
ncbi:hypothetical protein CDD82_3572 [Ophiocordyceps australis]|uniref:Polysaccharide biosynthesis protein C-terminal domain-containing protein n=1 Tax=Ophiocordyceps australis TaxID=1399860 RepID=A0A2C5ZBB4_9HYPO|nr:hypothetical protein CDD82_3572 [Ophiocordyceps australis]